MALMGHGTPVARRSCAVTSATCGAPEAAKILPRAKNLAAVYSFPAVRRSRLVMPSIADTRYFGPLAYEHDSGDRVSRRAARLRKRTPVPARGTARAPAAGLPAKPGHAGRCASRPCRSPSIDAALPAGSLAPEDLARAGLAPPARARSWGATCCAWPWSRHRRSAITANLRAPVVISLADAPRGAGHRLRRRLFAPPSARRRRGGRMLVMRRRAGRDDPHRRRDRDPHRPHRALAGEGRHRGAARDAGGRERSARWSGDQNRAAALGEGPFPAAMARALENAGKLASAAADMCGRGRTRAARKNTRAR